jgi:hypothetical protein
MHGSAPPHGHQGTYRLGQVPLAAHKEGLALSLPRHQVRHASAPPGARLANGSLGQPVRKVGEHARLGRVLGLRQPHPQPPLPRDGGGDRGLEEAEQLVIPLAIQALQDALGLVQVAPGVLLGQVLAEDLNLALLELLCVCVCVGAWV